MLIDLIRYSNCLIEINFHFQYFITTSISFKRLLKYLFIYQNIVYCISNINGYFYRKCQNNLRL